MPESDARRGFLSGTAKGRPKTNKAPEHQWTHRTCVHCCSVPCVHCCSGALCSLFIVVPVPCVHCCSVPCVHCSLLFRCLVFSVVLVPCVHCCSGALCSLLFRCLVFIVVSVPCVHCCSGALCSLLFRCLMFIVVSVPCVHCCSGALCSLLFRCLVFIVVPVPCWSSAFPFLTRTESPSGLRKTFPFPEQDSCATAVTMASAPRLWHSYLALEKEMSCGVQRGFLSGSGKGRPKTSN